MDVVVFLTDAPQSSTHFFILFIAKLPGGDHVIGLEESIAGDETVLGTEVVISVKFKFKLINFVWYFVEKLRNLPKLLLSAK